MAPPPHQDGPGLIQSVWREEQAEAPEGTRAPSEGRAPTADDSQEKAEDNPMDSILNQYWNKDKFKRKNI